MPINYSLLKESENEIMAEFKEFYNFVINMNQALYNFLENVEENEEKWIVDEELEHFHELSKKSELMKSDLLANCIWVIQKNEPRASHLRFVIAIVYSIKNLLNVSSNIEKIVKFFNKYKINFSMFKEFIVVHKETIELSRKISSSLVQKDIAAVQLQLKEEFSEYHANIKNLIRKSVYIHDDNIWKDNKDLIDFIVNMNRLENIMEYQEDILNDFSYIRK